MAVPLKAVEEANKRLSELKPGLVGVFVGGTSGIGEFTLKAFAKHAASPKIYIVGRNEAAASRIIEETKSLNPKSEAVFIKTPDASLIKNVDIACKEIQAKEEAINILFASQGYLTFRGREETSEGVDKKYSLNYHSRMRFIQNLLPQLSAGALQTNGLSRVVSILAAGREGKIYEDDLELKRNFSLSNCASHATTLTSLAMEELAKANPTTSFVHVSPGAVNTGVMDNGGALMKAAGLVARATLFWMMVPPLECGERNLFHATNERYAPKASANKNAVVGADGEKGSGAYLLNWDGKCVGNEKALKPLREKGFGKTAWEHTMAIFEQALAKTEDQ